MRAFLVINLALLLTGCGQFTRNESRALPELPTFRMTAPQQTNYFVLDRGNTSLIRAFDDGGRTVLQFADIDTYPPELYTTSGDVLRYRRIGTYAVLDGVTSRVVIRQGGRLAMVNHPSLPVGVADYPMLRDDRRLAVRLLDDPYANNPDEPRLAVRFVSGPPIDLQKQRGVRDGDILVRPLPRR